MKSLLTALQEGRLIELPETDKTKAFEYLGALIEAIPDVQVQDEGIFERVLVRERAYNTGIGKGWACPHARWSGDGEVVCAVGWSPEGILYGSPDGKPVHFIVMYFVPETQKNAYLKEISSLAKAIQTQPALQDLHGLTDLAEARHRLLDAIGLALESSAPEARARMIHLEARQAAETGHAPAAVLSHDMAMQIVPISVVASPSGRFIVLGQDPIMVEALEKMELLPEKLLNEGRYDQGNIHLLLRATTHYQLDRMVHECIAFQTR